MQGIITIVLIIGGLVALGAVLTVLNRLVEVIM